MVNKQRMGKHFRLHITDKGFSYERDTEGIAAEAALDGLYVIRTSVPAAELAAEETVRAYKGLAVVEHSHNTLLIGFDRPTMSGVIIPPLSSRLLFATPIPPGGPSASGAPHQ